MRTKQDITPRKLTARAWLSSLARRAPPVFLALGLLPEAECSQGKHESTTLPPQAVGPTVGAHPFLRKWSSQPLEQARTAAQSGDASAQYYLGWAHLCGLGTPPDTAEALRWFQKAADYGVPEAQVKAGMFYELGIATSRDIPAALEWYEKAAAQGYVGAQVRLGMIRGSRLHVSRVTVVIPAGHRKGSIFGQDTQESRRWLSLAAEQGYPLAQAMRGETCLHPRNTAAERLETAKWSLVAAGQGEPEARRWVDMVEKAFRGKATSFFNLTREEFAEARRQAAAFLASHPVKDWTHVTRVLFHLNPAAPPTRESAGSAQFDQLLAAGRNGDIVAQYTAALCFHHDPYAWYSEVLRYLPLLPAGTDRLPEEGSKNISERIKLATAWYTTAAKRGHVPSMLNLAFLYADGRLGDVNRDQAREWFSRAAQQGQPEAQFQLGRLLQEGKGVPANLAEAVKLYRAAAAQGHAEAEQALGRVTGTGTATAGVPRAAAPASSRSLAPGRSSTATRLAIVPTDPLLRTATDILTAELSKRPDLQLLERSEIDRVFQELALASSQKDFLKLGQTLGADGLLSLEPVTVDQKPRLQMTLVAVGPGVVLASEQYPLPLEDWAGWSALVVQQLEFLFPKLGVAAANAVPVSILNLRSAVATPETATLDRELTLLLTHRLVREKELFVLERRRMDALEREKQFQGKERAAFWNGSCLLDGTINKEGITAGKVTISGRLVSPEGGAGMTVEVSGRRDQLVRLVDELTGKLLGLLHRQSQVTVWDPLDEATRYFEETRWALNWKMLKEAQEASEASWALGVRLPELAGFRVRAYCDDIQANKLWASTTNGVPHFFADEHPDDANLVRALRALELYLDGSRHPGGGAKLDTTWHNLGADLLFRASALLRSYYYARHAREAAREQLAELRARTRELWHRLEPVEELRQDTSMFGFESTVFHYASYWQDTPQEDLAVQRAIMERGWHRRWPAEDHLMVPLPTAPIAWNAGDEARSPGLKRSFINQLCQSTNLMLRLEGLLLRVRTSGNNYEFEDNLVPLLDTVWTNHPQLLVNELWPPFWRDLRNMLGQRKGSGDFQSHTVQPFIQRMDAAISEAREAAKRKEADSQRTAQDSLREALRHHLETAQTIDHSSFFQRFTFLDFTPEQAKELLPLLQGYQQRLGHDGMKAFWLETKLKRLVAGSTTHPPAKPAPVAMTSNAPPRSASVPAAGLQPAPSPKPPSITTSVVTIDRFWPVPFKSTRERGFRDLTVNAVELNQNRLWVQVNFEENKLGSWNQFRSGMAICSVDPMTGTSDTFEVPAPEKGDPPPRSYGLATPKRYHLHSGSLFAPVEMEYPEARFGKCSLRTRDWRPMKTKWPLATRFFSVHGRFLLSTADSILELDPETEAIRVLASARRRPAETALDERSDLSGTLLFPGPEGSLRALVENTVYAYAPATRKWTELTSLPGVTATGPRSDWSAEVQGGTLLVHHATVSRDQRAVALYPDASAFQTLYVSRASAAFRMPGLPGNAESTVWDAPEGLSPAKTPHRIEGHNLWIVTDTSHFQSQSPGTPSPNGEALTATTTLLCFREGRKTPRAIPLRLSIPPEAAQALAREGAHLGGRHVPTGIEVGPDAIAIVCDGVPGAWFISRSGLQPRVEEIGKLVDATAQSAKAEEDAFIASITNTPMGQFPPDPKRMRLVMMFDLNHNQRWDTEEREAMRSYFRMQRANGNHSANAQAPVPPTVTPAPPAQAEIPAKAMEPAPAKAAEFVSSPEPLDIPALLADPAKARANRAAIRRALEAAARAGDPDAQVRLARFLVDVWGGGFTELDNAVYWAGKAVAAGRTEVYDFIGWSYLHFYLSPTVDAATGESRYEYSASNQNNALEWLKKGADLGQARSEAGLGLLLLKAHAEWRDPAEGRRLIRKAATAGDAAAQRLEGMMSVGELNGSGDEAGAQPDYAQAAVWYRKAAEQGDREATYQLARLYHDRRIPGTTADTVAWLQKAWDKWWSEALYLLLDYYEKGLATPRNPGERPFAIYQQLAGEMHPELVLKLAKAYRHGRDTVRDPYHAAVWYVEALILGMTEARAVFSMLDPQMRPRPQRNAADQEFAEALSLVCRGLALEDVAARVQVANQFLNPKAGDPDIVYSCAWFQLAAKKSDTQAGARVDELSKQLSEEQRTVVYVRVLVLENQGVYLNSLRKKSTGGELK